MKSTRKIMCGTKPAAFNPYSANSAHTDERGARPCRGELAAGVQTEGPDAGWGGVLIGIDELGPELGLAPLRLRPFAPHLTIGRTDGVRLGPVAARALEHAADGIAVRFEVDRIVLFRSILGGGPARYEALHEARLGA